MKSLMSIRLFAIVGGLPVIFMNLLLGWYIRTAISMQLFRMAMRLMSGEKQKPDRGKTIKIGMDGSYEWINYGLRTPNGIGLGIDGELFVTDNQGEWIPANKLIHVKKEIIMACPGDLPDSLPAPPPLLPRPSGCRKMKLEILLLNLY